LFAERAVDVLLNKDGNKVVGLQSGRIGSMDLQRSCETEKVLDSNLLNLAAELAT